MAPHVPVVKQRTKQLSRSAPPNIGRVRMTVLVVHVDVGKGAERWSGKTYSSYFFHLLGFFLDTLLSEAALQRELLWKR